MDTGKYVDNLFSGYEETPDLSDFKEELRSNLEDRIANLIKKGIPEQAAFTKATTELGDVSALADDISFTKKKEVFSEMYMKTKNYMNTWQKLGYTLMGGLLALGIILSLLAYFATDDIISGVGTLTMFFIAPICGFVFLGLTQETAKNKPMNWKRALLYVAAVAVILFGLAVSAMAFLEVQGATRALASIGSLIPFVLPGSVALAFLLLTEKSRRKSWVVEQETAWSEHMRVQFADPYAATRFGLFSGSLWIFAIALFAILGFLIGFQYSWLVFILAVAGQILIQALMIPKNKR